MSISPILNNGMIQRTDDVGYLKHQQDAKPVVEQQNAMTQVNKKAEELRHEVVTPNDADKADTHADAREKGKNKYFFSQKSKKKTETSQDSKDRVVKKTMGGSFDMKV